MITSPPPLDSPRDAMRPTDLPHAVTAAWLKRLGDLAPKD